MAKIKTVILSAPYHNHPESFDIVRYRVERITDSVEFSPNQFLEKKQVEELCASKDWKVIIVPLS